MANNCNKIVIKDNDNNKTYTLEYNRKALIIMEDQGFNFNEFNRKPIKSVSMLVAGAFIKNHPEKSADEIEAIVSKLPNRDEFIKKCSLLYADCLNAIAGKKKDEKDNSKNLTWGEN